MSDDKRVLMERVGDALWEADFEYTYAAFKCMLERWRDKMSESV